MADLVVKDNALINASYNLDLVEQRLVLLAIIEARESQKGINANDALTCLLYTSPSPRDRTRSRMPSSA